MKKPFLAFVLTILSAGLSAQNSPVSVSVDPVTFIGLLLIPEDENGEARPADIRNMWLCVELNMETKNKRELGVGIFARADRAALRTQYRFFYNKERQSGFFWGLYGHIEWRRMYWKYDGNNEIMIGWNFPFAGDRIFHSIGITGGADIGFRIRVGKIGITPFMGLGIPLFICFGDFPPEKDRELFNLQNIAFRAVDIGLRLDFFP